jgi:hypothetical protein
MVGEHIRALKDGRWNHAIDCGDETVIHLAVDGAAASRVRRSYRPEFVAGAEAVEVVTHRERTFPASEVVARAYSRISDPGLAAMFRDSEAFAEWCVTGRLGVAPQNNAVSVPGAAPAPLAARSAPPAPAPAPAPERPERPAARRRAPAPAKPKRPAPARKAAPARVKKARAKAPARKPAPARIPAKAAAKRKPAKQAARKVAKPARATRRGARHGRR